MRRDEMSLLLSVIISVKQNKTASSDSTAEFKDVKVVKRFNVGYVKDFTFHMSLESVHMISFCSSY